MFKKVLILTEAISHFAYLTTYNIGDIIGERCGLEFSKFLKELLGRYLLDDIFRPTIKLFLVVAYRRPSLSGLLVGHEHDS